MKFGRILRHIYESDSRSMVMWAYFAIFARTLLLSRDIFVEILTIVGRKLNVTGDEVLAKILDACSDSMPSESHSRRKKLLSLALASLLTVQSRVVLERLPSILRGITETLNDIIKVNSNGTLVDVFVPESESPQPDDSDNDDEWEDIEPQTEHSKRKLKLDREDIVHTVRLSSYLQSQLAELMNQAGAQQMQEMMRTVDSETLCQLKEYGVI